MNRQLAPQLGRCFVLSLMVTLVFVLGCRESTDDRSLSRGDYHTRIRTKEVRHSLLFKPVHAGSGDYNSLIVDGREYRDVRGFPPYFIDIPEQKRIVFATGTWGPSNPAVIHVVDFPENRHRQFRTTWGEGSGFGDGIRREVKGERNAIEKSSEDEIVLIDESLGVRTMRKIVLDLKFEKIREVQWFIYDDKGKLTNSHIFKNAPEGLEGRR